MRRIGVEERRARLARRHRLAAGYQAPGVSSAAEAMVGLHATDPLSVYLGASARSGGLAPAEIERALYDDRTVVRMLGMRRTMFVVPVGLVPVIQAAGTDAIAVLERRKLLKYLGEGGVKGGDGWLREVEAETLAAVEARGEALAGELSAAVEPLRTEVEVGAGTKWALTQRLTSRVLTLMAADGLIVRGRPRGRWNSTQHRWAPAAAWFDGSPSAPWGTDEARVELIRRWLATFGPGTVADVKWWTGLSMGQVRRALSEIEPQEVDLDGIAGLVVSDDIDPVASPEPWAALLPPLDPTPMGWQGRAWYLGEHGPALFDRSGNIGPMVWWDGRIVGGWAQRADGDSQSGVDASGCSATRCVRASPRSWEWDVGYSGPDGEAGGNGRPEGRPCQPPPVRDRLPCAAHPRHGSATVAQMARCGNVALWPGVSGSLGQ